MSSQRVAVVTGGNRGIGLEVSRQLAARGLKVVLAARDEEKAKRAAASLQGDVVPFALDVTDPQAPARLLESFAQVDVLVNNAGVFIDRDYGGLNLPIPVLRDTLEVNLIGPWQLSEAVAPGMRQRGYGRIINVSSGLGAMSEMSGGYPAYRVSKSSLNALTRILADELRGSNVLVNAVCPGWVQTDMGGPRAPVPVAQGADTIVWLATLPDGGPTGSFFRNRRQIPW
jgi:NAD(P)-dependent dehydrogenase (short-subunit alcohol dehydrogenase family)